MSQEQAKELITRIKSDAAFKDRIQVLKDAEKKIAFINDAGYNCTLSEIEQEQKEVIENQIEGAAGGNLLWFHDLGI
jgi:predicted ribosomally synthesized peptide with nif11-like leader